MSGSSSPFIGIVRNKKGVTWGSIRSDPQVIAFSFLSGYRIRVLFWIPRPTTQARPDRSDGRRRRRRARDIFVFVSVHPFTKVGTPGAHPWRSLFPYINTC